MTLATVFFMPGSETKLAILKPAWAADNGVETAVFPTQEEAIQFAMKRWRLDREHIKIDITNAIQGI